MHLLYLMATTAHSYHHYLFLIYETLRSHFQDRTINATNAFPYGRLGIATVLLTIGMALPGLLWYLAVSLASISAVTAIWNTNAFWAYLLAVWLLDEDSDPVANAHMSEHTSLNPSSTPTASSKWWKRLEPTKLVAVGMACVGVVVVVYSGREETDEQPSASAPSAPLAGVLLTLAASFLYALVQVLYKKYISLPNSPAQIAGLKESPLVTYQRLPADGETRETGQEDSLEDNGASYAGDVEDNGAPNVGEETLIVRDHVTSLPFGLYANLITSLVGVGTLLLLWPILLIPSSSPSVSPAPSPSGPSLIPSIIALAISGLTFNTAYLILLSIWGPVLTSVGNLLTIVLILLVEITIMSAPLPNLETVIGCGMIAGGFGVLLWGIKRDGS